MAVILTLAMVISFMPAMTLTVEAADIIPSTSLSGSGTAEAPFEIASAADLAYMRDQVNVSGGTITPSEGGAGVNADRAHYKLTADIVLGHWQDDGDGIVEDDEIYDSASGGTAYIESNWTPIGKYTSYPFYGCFDGDGHTVSGIYINTDSNFQGLFGNSNNGTIKNLGVKDSYIKGENSVGGIVASIVASNTATVQCCYNTGSVIGNQYIGGVVGRRQYDGTVANCYNTGKVSGVNYVGGVAGSSQYIGAIKNCYNTGIVSGTESVGGVVGKTGNNSNNSKVQNCYNTGIISGDKDVGGVVGTCAKQSTVQYCYNAGSVSGTTSVGGVIGQNSGTVTGCYYDKQMCPVEGINGQDTLGASGKLTSDMTSDTAFSYQWTSDETGIWNFTAGLYPRLTGYVNESTDYEMDETDAAKVSTSPVFLAHTDANTDTAANVISSFTLSTENGMSWSSGNDGVISISGGSATVVNTGDTVLTATRGGISKTVNLTVPELAPPILQSAVYTSNTQITVTLSESCKNLAKANDGGFTVTETGTGTTFAVTATSQGVDDKEVLLTVADITTAGVKGVTVTYTASTNGTITDIVGNPLATNSTGIEIPAWQLGAATVNITAPVMLGTPQTAEQVQSATANANYTVTNVVWNEGLTAGGKFKAGQIYTATVTLTSKNGKEFRADPFTPTIAGVSSVGETTTTGAGTGNTVTFTVTFPATEALSVTAIAVKEQPIKLTYTAGESLDLAGLVATLTYNDTTTLDVAMADFEANGITADPANGTVMTVAAHNGNEITLTCNTHTTTTSSLIVNAAALTGTACITGSAVYGQTLMAGLTGSNNTGTLSYQWARGGIDIAGAAASEYTLVRADIGAVIRVKISSNVETGTLTSDATAEVGKANCGTATGLTPELSAKTHYSITVTSVAGYEYLLVADGASATGTWQNSNVFTSLSAITSYDIYQRIKETETHKASGISIKLDVTTNAAPTYAASVNPTSTTFAAVGVGYGAQVEQEFTITNDGSGTITNLSATLGGSNFEISAPISAETLNPTETATVSIRPITGLSSGNYTDTLSITADNGISLAVPLSFTVLSPAIDPASQNYDLNAPADITAIITWNGATSVTDAVYSMSPDTTVYYSLDTGDYNIDDNSLSIESSFFSDFPFTSGAALDFVFTFNTGDEANLTVNVVDGFVPVTAITGVPDTATAGMPLTLTGTVVPYNATNQTITWSVYNEGDTGASIAGNILSTTGAGVVIVTATVTNGLTASTDYTQNFNITVNAAPIITYTVTATAGSGGAISPSGAVSVNEGGSQTFSITANSGYQISTVSVDGVNQGAMASYTFTNVTADHTISAAFTQISSDEDSDDTPKPPEKTITVTETSSEVFKNTAGTITAEADMEDAFSYSVEVKVTDTQEDAASFRLSAGDEVFPFDISLYIKGTDEKTEPAPGYAVTISLPVPENLLAVRELLTVMHKSDSGIMTEITSRLLQKDGVWYLVFEATEFSPYALVVRNAGSYDEASGVPYYSDANGNKVFIGFAANGKYVAPAGMTVSVMHNGKSFTDAAGHWAAGYIGFVTEREIFVGTGGNTFSPDIGMTRAMFATVIGRLYERSYGEIEMSGNQSFTDCGYDAYYGKYIAWASENGIINGYGNGRFGPDDQITREQMAAILYRFADFLGVFPDSMDTALDYPDADSISDYAQTAALYCQTTGVIGGYTGGVFAPQKTATRAEVSTIIQRFIEFVLG